MNLQPCEPSPNILSRALHAFVLVFLFLISYTLIFFLHVHIIAFSLFDMRLVLFVFLNAQLSIIFTGLDALIMTLFKVEDEDRGPISDFWLRFESEFLPSACRNAAGESIHHLLQKKDFDFTARLQPGVTMNVAHSIQKWEKSRNTLLQTLSEWINKGSEMRCIFPVEQS